MLELTKENFNEEVVQSEIPVIVDFWAPWCGPCRMMAPVFEKLSSQYKGKMKFAKLNTDEQESLSMDHQIRSIPCLVVFNKGKEAERLIGYKPESALKADIDSILKKI